MLSIAKHARRLLLPLLAIIAVSCGEVGDGMSDFRSFAPDTVAEWALADTVASYDRETIFKYINGAGEVYLSYGFRKVDVFEYRCLDRDRILLEIFDMGVPDDAYGVFSFARESEDTGIGRAYEFRGGLLSFWQDRYFVCVSSKRPDPETEAAMRALATTIGERMPNSAEPPAILHLLPSDGLAAGSIRLFHKHASLNYYYYLAEDNLLGLDSGTTAVLGEYRPGPAYLLVALYPSAKRAEAAQSAFADGYAPETSTGTAAMIEENKWTQIKRSSEYLAVVLDAPTSERAGELLDSALTRISDLREGR